MNTLKIEGNLKSLFSLPTPKVVDDAPIWSSWGWCTSTSLSFVLGGPIWSAHQPHTQFNNCNTILSCVARNHANFCLLCSSLHLQSYFALLHIASPRFGGGVRKNFGSELSGCLFLFNLFKDLNVSQGFPNYVAHFFDLNVSLLMLLSPFNCTWQ
jgi:hypothetical protein